MFVILTADFHAIFITNTSIKSHSAYSETLPLSYAFSVNMKLTVNYRSTR